MNNAVDVLVLGGGPGGYTAALYAARAGLSVLVLERLSAGGQMATTGTVENYPGFEDGVDGFELGEKMQRQAQRFGARTVLAEVREVALTESPKRVETDRGTFLGRTVVVATGAEARELGVPGEAALRGRGVSYCATCDGMLYRGRNVVVLSWTGSAEREADFLRGIGCAVRYYDRPQGVEILGEEAVTGVRVNGREEAADAVFLLRPAVAPAALLPGLAMENGSVTVDRQMATNLPGLFAAGDCTGGPLQVSKAAGDGLIAGQSAAAWAAAQERREKQS